MNKKIRSSAGQEIEPPWDPRRCIDSAECIHGLPEVFDTELPPWIEPAGTVVEAGKPAE